MATETLRPNGELSDVGLVANTYTDHDGDPDTDSTTIAATSSSANTEWGGDFPTPSGPPTVGAGLQEFVVGVDEQGLGLPLVRLELWENGSLVRAQTDSALAPGYNKIAMTWNASELSTSDGSLVQCKCIGTAGGGGSINIGNMEWRVVYTPDYGLTADPGSADATGKVATFTEVEIFTLTANSTAISLVGKTATLQEVGVYPLTASPGSVGTTGKTSTFTEVEIFPMIAGPATAGIVGKVATFTELEVFPLAADSGSVSATGKVATFSELMSTQMTATSGAFSVTGKVATLSEVGISTLDADPGPIPSVGITGKAATLTKIEVFNFTAGPSNVTTVGEVATFESPTISNMTAGPSSSIVKSSSVASFGNAGKKLWRNPITKALLRVPGTGSPMYSDYCCCPYDCIGCLSEYFTVTIWQDADDGGYGPISANAGPGQQPPADHPERPNCHWWFIDWPDNLCDYQCLPPFLPPLVIDVYWRVKITCCNIAQPDGTTKHLVTIYFNQVSTCDGEPYNGEGNNLNAPIETFVCDSPLSEQIYETADPGGLIDIYAGPLNGGTLFCPNFHVRISNLSPPIWPGG